MCHVLQGSEMSLVHKENDVANRFAVRARSNALVRGGSPRSSQGFIRTESECTEVNRGTPAIAPSDNRDAVELITKGLDAWEVGSQKRVEDCPLDGAHLSRPREIHRMIVPRLRHTVPVFGGGGSTWHPHIADEDETLGEWTLSLPSSSSSIREMPCRIHRSRFALHSNRRPSKRAPMQKVNW